MQFCQQHVGNVDIPCVVRFLLATCSPREVPLKGGTPPGPGAPFAHTITIIHRNYVPGSSTLITPTVQPSPPTFHVLYLFTLFDFDVSTLDKYTHGFPPLSSHILLRPLSFHHTVPGIFLSRNSHPLTHALRLATNALVFTVIDAAAVCKCHGICSNYRSLIKRCTRISSERVSRDTCVHFIRLTDSRATEKSRNTCRDLSANNILNSRANEHSERFASSFCQ